MAFETINLYGRVSMAGRAEVFLVLNACDCTVTGRSIMAVNAFFQAVLFGAYTFAQGVVTLVQYKRHVIFSHYVNFFNALGRFVVIAFCLGAFRQQRICLNRKGHKNRQYKREDYFFK